MASVTSRGRSTWHINGSFPACREHSVVKRQVEREVEVEVEKEVEERSREMSREKSLCVRVYPSLSTSLDPPTHTRTRTHTHSDESKQTWLLMRATLRRLYQGNCRASWPQGSSVSSHAVLTHTEKLLHPSHSNMHDKNQ